MHRLQTPQRGTDMEISLSWIHPHNGDDVHDVKVESQESGENRPSTSSFPASGSEHQHGFLDPCMYDGEDLVDDPELWNFSKWPWPIRMEDDVAKTTETGFKNAGPSEMELPSSAWPFPPDDSMEWMFEAPQELCEEPGEIDVVLNSFRLKTMSEQGTAEISPVPQPRNGFATCPADGCGKSFTRLSEMKKHEKIHNDRSRRPHRCEQCSMAFLWPKDLKRHRQSRHEPCVDEKNKHFCPARGCKYFREGFQRKDKLLRHLQRKHSDCSRSSSVCSDGWDMKRRDSSCANSRQSTLSLFSEPASMASSVSEVGVLTTRGSQEELRYADKAVPSQGEMLRSPSSSRGFHKADRGRRP